MTNSTQIITLKIDFTEEMGPPGEWDWVSEKGVEAVVLWAGPVVEVQTPEVYLNIYREVSASEFSTSERRDELVPVASILYGSGSPWANSSDRAEAIMNVMEYDTGGYYWAYERFPAFSRDGDDEDVMPLQKGEEGMTTRVCDCGLEILYKGKDLGVTLPHRCKPKGDNK